MSKFCTQCGNAVEDNATFCTQCGASLAAPQAAPQPEAQPVYQAPQQPAYQAPQQPAYQAPQQSGYQQPVYQQPVYQQPVYQQPIYQQPVYQAAPQAQGNGAGTAGMVLGIIALVFGVVGLIFLGIGWWMAPAALIFWIIAGILMLPGFGLSLGGSFGNKPKGKAVAGLILNGLILILWVYLIVAGGSFFNMIF